LGGVVGAAVSLGRNFHSEVRSPFHMFAYSSLTRRYRSSGEPR
jgi:hypothetical protein